MNLINNIAKYKTLILVVGIVAALGMIAQPIAKTYAECEIISQVDKNAADTQQDGADDENPNEAQISTLEAVAPTAQIHFAPLDFILVKTSDPDVEEIKGLTDTTIRLPEKLLKVLFNIIIAPNAP